MNKNKLYLDSGFLNVDEILKIPVPFIFIVGARGIGKTYGILKNIKDNDIKFIMLRRTQHQVETVSKPQFQPFKALNIEQGYNVEIKKISKDYSVFYEKIDDSEEINLGYLMALSTISNIRGFDASDIKLIFYDEFIKEKHEKPVKDEGIALLNAYETVNRNRELKGRDPVKLIAASNSNDLGNPVFMQLKLISRAEKMRKKGQEISVDYDRGIAIIQPLNSPISEAKKETALYKLTYGTDFSEMAIDNNYQEMNTTSVKSRPLTEYRPLVTVGEITLYRHKSKGSYYCSTHRLGDPPEFGVSETELLRFSKAYRYIYDAYLRDAIDFEDVTCEVLLTKYFY